MMVVLLLAVCSQAARATVIEIAFEGVVDQVSDLPVDWVSDAVVGATFTGSYVYDSDTVNVSSDPLVGIYMHYSAPYGVLVTIGNLVFQSDPCNIELEVDIANNTNSSVDDRYGFSSSRGHNLLPDGTAGVNYAIWWVIRDDSANVLNDVALPLTAPVLSQWNYNMFEIDGPWNNSYGIRGHVTQVTLVPEPTMLGFVFLGGVMLLKRQRQKGVPS